MEKTIENMDRNRLGILIRCLVILLITGVTNSAAVFVSPLAAHFNWTADAIANVSTTMLLCWTPGALIGGTLMSKIGARNAMLLGAVLFPLGTLTSSFVPQSAPWLLYVTFSFLQGLGNGLAYSVATYVSTGWYPDKRGLVSGLCMAFTGGSSAFLAPICSKLVQSTGIISTLRIVGLVSLVVCVVCAHGVRQPPVGNKPAGIAVHPAALTEETATIAGAAAHYLHSESFHAVNRLDRGTTGVMAVAKTGFIHARCMAMLHTDDFRREYRAVCEGIPSPAEGDIDLPIGRAESSLLKRQADPLGQPAHTHYEVLAASQGRARLRLTPTTGRTQQLRVHMAAIGHPLTGDWLYGTEDRALIARPALHSYHLRMMHPLTGTTIDVTAPLPEDIQRLLKEERL